MLPCLVVIPKKSSGVLVGSHLLYVWSHGYSYFIVYCCFCTQSAFYMSNLGGIFDVDKFKSKLMFIFLNNCKEVARSFIELKNLENENLLCFPTMFYIIDCLCMFCKTTISYCLVYCFA